MFRYLLNFDARILLVIVNVQIHLRVKLCKSVILQREHNCYISTICYPQKNVAILNSFVLCLETLGKWQGVYLKAIGLYRSGETEQKGLF
jgi:hypothetical protein